MQQRSPVGPPCRRHQPGACWRDWLRATVTRRRGRGDPARARWHNHGRRGLRRHRVGQER